MSTALGGSTDGGTGAGDAGGGSSSTGGAPNTGTTGAPAATTGAPAPSGAAAPGGTALAGGTSAAPQNWRESLPDDLKADPTLAKFSDVANLSRSYIEAQKKIGQKGIFKPGPNDGPEAWKAFREALGVPSADKYEVAQPKGFEFPSDSIDWAKKVGAEVGILPEDMNKVLQSYAEFETARDAQVEKEIDEEAKSQLADLQKEWGETYDTQIQRASYAAKQIGGDEFIKYLNETGMGNDVNLIRFMSKVAPLLGEDRLREGNLGNGRSTLQEIDNEIASLRANAANNGFYNKNHAAHAATVARYESLMKQKTGGK